MSIKNLKNLIEENLIEQNEFLAAYEELITRNMSTLKQKGLTDCHHIIPRAYYKSNKSSVDNSQANKVNLLHKDHILAHYYLAKCTRGSLKFSMSQAFLRITARKDLKQAFDEVLNYLDDYQDIYEWTLQERSRAYAGRKQSAELINKRLSKIRSLCASGDWKPNKGKIWVHKDSVQHMILHEELTKYLEEGYLRGRGPANPEAVEKTAAKKRGTAPWNKGLNKYNDKRVAKGAESQHQTRSSMDPKVKKSIGQKISQNLKAKYTVYNPHTDEYKKITLEDIEGYQAAGWIRKGKKHKKKT